jgi:succinate dehydrogenase / fumarate reductase, cytochrome b subunit
MNLKQFYSSTVGKKVVVALTGLFLVFFVVGHMAGNLKAFAGYAPDGIHKLDHYAEFLRSIGEQVLGKAGFLWGFRVALLVALILHVVTVIQLQIRNRAARGTKYAVQKMECASWSARLMFWGGLLLLVFVIFHLLHLTVGTLHFQGFEHGKVYHNVWSTFQVGGIVLFYLLALVALGLHLAHGVWSVCQTLGLNSPGKNSFIRISATVLALVMVVGFASVPLAVYFGALGAPKAAVKIESHR